MKIDKIISMANKNVRLQFLAMERSLRATGCQLPIWVIPYDDQLFELPPGSSWWKVPGIINWLNSEKTHPAMRKYQCLTVGNYQFVDADICFLKNPEKVLQPYCGFITSCGHWRYPGGTYTKESLYWMSSRTTNWQSNVFNTGQFACDSPLYTVESLKTVATSPDFITTCIRWPHNEQPGLDILVFASGVEITNLTLPPHRMESTWAGEYLEDYEHYWRNEERKPYLIHWAGVSMDSPCPINQIFYQFLKPDEKIEWEQSPQYNYKNSRGSNKIYILLHRIYSNFRTALKTLLFKNK